MSYLKDFGGVKWLDTRVINFFKVCTKLSASLLENGFGEHGQHFLLGSIILLQLRKMWTFQQYSKKRLKNAYLM